MAMLHLSVEEDFANRCRTAATVRGMTLAEFVMEALRMSVELTEEVVVRGNGNYEAGIQDMSSGPKLDQ